jgi:hypothetical protein
MGSRLVADVSLAILELAEEDKLARMHREQVVHPPWGMREREREREQQRRRR